ncbi:MAG: ferrous iron transport protein B [Ignavibacteriae bacterium]|nr:ferrous iron transport protein B [Ignavibacteriota bacterium]NOG96972.1 ferrous iron transport protein B [Ignavibacteriota bacterium]
MSMQQVGLKKLITLVGPPNSGKTTLFNFLSGKNCKTVNYPGSTVEYSSCKIQAKFNLNAELLDSPGIISLIPNSPDEKVAIDSIYDHPEFGHPDLVIVTVDSSQLSRHLLLVKQLIDSNFRVILALTMNDILIKKGMKISVSKLKEELNCEVISIDGRLGSGVDSLIQKTDEILNDDSYDSSQIKVPQFDNDYLLSSFKEIERIEDLVIEDIEDEDTEPSAVTGSIGKVVPPKIKTFKPDLNTLLIDRYLLHRVWGLLFFFLIMGLTFTSIFWAAIPLMDLIDSAFGFLAGAAKDSLGSNWFSDLISDGIISGAGSVLVFVPQIIILFLILGVLEDTGYLARGAMLIDKPLSKIGLNGRSFVPMLSGFACAIPAIMAARTIPNKRERLLTIFIIPLMSCSARLPVYALLIAYLTPRDSIWAGGIALAAIYIFSIVSSLVVAGIINKFSKGILKEEDDSSFILELPAYRIPKLKVVLNNTYYSSKMYLKKAGPIILFFSIILWMLTYFPNTNPQINTQGLTEPEIEAAVNAERLADSYAADIGKIIEPIMTPIGMDWRVGVSLIAAFTAREVFVSALALIFKVTDSDEDAIQSSILKAMRDAKIESTGEKLFTPATIVGLIVFFMFALQCLSTVAVSKKETGGWRIPILQIIVFTSTAYLLAFITVNGLRFLGVS